MTGRPLVTIDVTSHPPHTPLGIRLAPSMSQRRSPVVVGWEHVPSSSTSLPCQLGPIQRSGRVRLGDRLVQINQRDVTHLTVSEIVTTLRQLLERSAALTSLGFAPNPEEEDGGGRPPMVSHKRITYSFTSSIPRWRVQEDTTGTQRPYIQYEITCQFHIRDQQAPSHSWSVWKRYSQFQQLDAELRSIYGWQMEKRGIRFPQRRYLQTVWYDRVHRRMDSNNGPYPKSFVTKRQTELNVYWSQLLQMEEGWDMVVHHCSELSQRMAVFLEMDRTADGTTPQFHSIRRQNDREVQWPMGTIPDDDVSLLTTTSFVSGGTTIRRSPWRPTRRRQDAKSAFQREYNRM